jgi:hypothetical protein
MTCSEGAAEISLHPCTVGSERSAFHVSFFFVERRAGWIACENEIQDLVRS